MVKTYVWDVGCLIETNFFKFKCLFVLLNDTKSFFKFKLQFIEIIKVRDIAFSWTKLSMLLFIERMFCSNFFSFCFRAFLGWLFRTGCCCCCGCCALSFLCFKCLSLQHSLSVCGRERKSMAPKKTTNLTTENCLNWSES